jgi:hypothetical protein
LQYVYYFRILYRNKIPTELIFEDTGTGTVNAINIKEINVSQLVGSEIRSVEHTGTVFRQKIQQKLENTTGLASGTGCF